MIFTFKCRHCERIFMDEAKSNNGLLQLCFRCLPVTKEHIDLD